MSFVGIDIGALTVKVVALRGDSLEGVVQCHQGRPLEMLDEMLAQGNLSEIGRAHV